MTTAQKSKKKPALFEFKPFSKKQKKILTWWTPKSPVKEKDGIICDGAVRAGKTVVMSLSYVMWAMAYFNDENFGMAGKTIGAHRRNVITPLKRMLKSRGYRVKDHRADNYMAISRKGKTNYFYIFGGKDERSQDLIQGITLAGMFFDEVALMPESFVSQAEARCSVAGAKFWYNCNPESPYHWFKEKYIDNLKQKNLIHLHFTMEDNPSLDLQTLKRYKRMFTGVFYKRYIEGLWVVAEGIIYEMFDHDKMVVNDEKMPGMERKWIACDYGTSNATTFILFGLGIDGRLYVMNEYYHSGRTERKKSPSKYAKDFWEWVDKNNLSYKEVESIFIDPSAEGFILELYNTAKDQWKRRIDQADNEVKRGIELVSSIIDNDYFRVHERCTNVRKEIASYAWDDKAAERGEDKPIKANDHTMDPVRYCANGTRRIWQSKGITQKEGAA